jgi:CHAT domain-containing protein
MICANYAVSSYTPTLAALIHARKNYQPFKCDDSKIILAAVPQPPEMYGKSHLPYTVQEVEEVASVVPSSVLVSLPAHEGSKVDGLIPGITSESLMARLPYANIVHLACHGVQNQESPLDSGFLMHDGLLTISTLMPVPLPNAFLAFLSACETAKGDLRQPNQIVHLAATMLFAGFKSVIATLW